MPHTFKSLDDRTFELRYTGVVGYAERIQAIEAVTDALKAGRADRLLIDFSQATAIEEDRSLRADFIARAITHLNIEGARVALVGIAADYAWPAELACEIRHVPARRFDTREDARAWLAAEDIDALQPAG